MNQELTIIDQFKDKYKPFSNFCPCVIYFEGREYPTVEHAFVAAKTKDEEFRKMISKLPAEDAGYAKRLGRNKKKCKLRKDWDIIKIGIMKRLLVQKFNYDEFKLLLLSTGDSILREGNYWHDNYWGDCFCKDCKNIKGLNNLGILLMKIREMLRGE
jgi:ribA/ribD-fused uncharacterized protein